MIKETKSGLKKYLKSVEDTANALALLVGEPLTGRRFLAEFARRVEALDHPGMYAGLMGLVGAPRVEVETLHDWLSIWETSYNAASITNRPAEIHRYRRDYYLRACEFILANEMPKNVLWPLLYTWTQVAGCLPEG